MILCDTGPIVAILNRNDSQHARCVAAIQNLPPVPLVTTVPCLVEAMYLLHRVAGAEGQKRLWNMRREGKLIVYLHTAAELDRIEALMYQYEDVPMDFADASLVVAAESLGVHEILTLDSHFYAYRTATGEAFIVYP